MKMATTPTGTLMKKIQRHEKLSVIQPPSVGPMMGATTTPIPYTAIAMPCLLRGKLSTRMAWEIGCRPPPPAPCRTRKKMSRKRLGARPHRNELMVKMTTQPMNSRFRPNSMESQPVSGSTMAFEIKYEVRTQVLSSTVAERLPAMWGSETLAMLVSSTSMKVASITVAAISQGLTLGTQGTGGFATGASTVAIRNHGGPTESLYLSLYLPAALSIAFPNSRSRT